MTLDYISHCEGVTFRVKREGLPDELIKVADCMCQETFMTASIKRLIEVVFYPCYHSLLYDAFVETVALGIIGKYGKYLAKAISEYLNKENSFDSRHYKSSNADEVVKQGDIFGAVIIIMGGFDCYNQLIKLTDTIDHQVFKERLIIYHNLILTQDCDF